jgi:hypothetical protein
MMVEFSEGDLNCLEALLWWCRGFNAANGGAHRTGMPNIIGLGLLRERMMLVEVGAAADREAEKPLTSP